MKHLYRIFKLIPKSHRYIWMTALYSLLYAIFTALRPLAFKSLVDAIAQASSGAQFINNSWWLLILILFITLVSVLFDTLAYRQGEQLWSTVINELRRATYNKLEAKDVHYFESARSGEIISKVMEGMGHFSNWINTLVWNFLPGTSIIIVTFILIYQKLGWVSLLAAACIPIEVFFFLRAGKISRPYGKKAGEYGDKAVGFMSESFNNIATVRTLNAEDYFNERHDTANNTAFNEYKGYIKTMYQHIMVREWIIQSILLIPLAFVLFGVADKSYSYGDIIYIALLMQQFGNNLFSIGRTFNQTVLNETRAANFLSIIEAEPEVIDDPDAVELTKLESIEFRDVSFSYPGNKKGAIHSISFKIEPGQTLALVGPSGVGKSTITKLLLRFYHPTEGEILINGQDASTYTASSIRQHIGMVMQDVALFNTSIEDNISVANSKAKREALEAAAKQAHAAEFIDELPDKYKTLVGERGVKLSGGQKQRVAIARAILKDPQLIILDEATSALDSESERMVQDGLRKLMKGRSALVIAHRLSTIMHADTILVLKNGRVYETGDHSSLLKADGLYAKLFRLQSATGKIEL